MEMAFPVAQYGHFCNLLRWHDFVQDTIDVTSVLPPIKRKLPLFDFLAPCKPPVSISRAMCASLQEYTRTINRGRQNLVAQKRRPPKRKLPMRMPRAMEICQLPKKHHNPMSVAFVSPIELPGVEVVSSLGSEGQKVKGHEGEKR